MLVPVALVGTVLIWRALLEPSDRPESLLLGLMLIPSQVAMIPLFLMLKEVGLVNTYAGLIVANCSLSIPLAITIMRPYFLSVPGVAPQPGGDAVPVAGAEDDRERPTRRARAHQRLDVPHTLPAFERTATELCTRIGFLVDAIERTTTTEEATERA